MPPAVPARPESSNLPATRTGRSNRLQAETWPRRSGPTIATALPPVPLTGLRQGGSLGWAVLRQPELGSAFRLLSRLQDAHKPPRSVACREREGPIVRSPGHGRNRPATPPQNATVR